MKELGIALVAALACACDDGSVGDHGAARFADAGMTEPYIALERDFRDFQKWEAFPLGVSAAMGTVHVAGKRTDFLNRRPPAGATAFPVGTIVVKVIESTDPKVEKQIFAMVKRGGGYNDQGAQGWEWFELEVPPGQPPVVVWRGTAAPTAEKYGGEKVGTCNECHRVAVDNDFVQAPPLKLPAVGSGKP